VSDPKKPGRRSTLTLTDKGGKLAAPGAPEKPQQPRKLPAPPRPRGPTYTPPGTHEPFLERFWLVKRSNGRRPKMRQLMVEAAQEEAARVSVNNPGADVWVIECRIIETFKAPAIEGETLVSKSAKLARETSNWGLRSSH
jgi:hypothetical protein